MEYVKLTILTPVHIGSGRIFKQNIDCLYFKDENAWGIVDEAKVLSIIGEKNIDQWISNIEGNKPITDLVAQRKKNLKAKDISVRVLAKGNSSEFPPKENELREQLHTHQQIPLIPGSSIKGGFRTAVFSKILQEKVTSGQYEINSNSITNYKGEFQDKEINKDLLGKTPNDDPFRFLRISDFHFNTTEAWIAGSFNNQKWEDNRLKQWIEVVPRKSVSYGTLEAGGVRVLPIKRSQRPVVGFKSVKDLNSIPELFKTVNQHTSQLIERELKWAVSKDDLDSNEATQDYISILNSVLEEVKNADSTQSCILRIGYGIGSKFMTGDWQKICFSPDLYNSWKAKLRKPHHEKFEFPKTRRMIEGGIPLGFIRIDLLPEGEIPDLSISDRIKAEILTNKSEVLTPIKPEYFSGLLKKNIEVIGQYVGVGSSAFMKKFKLLIGEPGKEPIVETRYPSDVISDSYHYLRVNTLKKSNTEIESIAYIRPW
jgi:CRISPR-associated protein Csm5